MNSFNIKDIVKQFIIYLQRTSIIGGSDFYITDRTDKMVNAEIALVMHDKIASAFNLHKLKNNVTADGYLIALQAGEYYVKRSVTLNGFPDTWRDNRSKDAFNLPIKRQVMPGDKIIKIYDFDRSFTGGNGQTSALDLNTVNKKVYLVFSANYDELYIGDDVISSIALNIGISGDTITGYGTGNTTKVVGWRAISPNGLSANVFI